MNISNITGIGKIKEILKTDKTKKSENINNIKRSDKVQISKEAQQSAEVQKYVEIVKNSSDVRADRVAQAKEKLLNGELMSKESLEKVSERLAEKFEIGDKILKSLG